MTVVARSQVPTGWSDAPALHVVDSDGQPEEVPYVEIIVPALNEEVRLGASLQRIAEYLSAQPYRAAIAVVDNGSVDRTADLVVDGNAARVPIRLIGCAQRGKGAAVRRGVLTSRATYIGFCDADLATPIETLDVVLPALEAGDPVVISSRRCPGAEYVVNQPLTRRFASHGFRFASRLCLSQLREVHDTQCGFKFFERSAAQRLFGASKAAGFAFDAEIIGLALLGGYEVRELPARWEHQEGSRLTILRDAKPVLGELLAMRANLRRVSRAGFADPAPTPSDPAAGDPQNLVTGARRRRPRPASGG